MTKLVLSTGFVAAFSHLNPLPINCPSAASFCARSYTEPSTAHGILTTLFDLLISMEHLLTTVFSAAAMSCPQAPP